METKTLRVLAVDQDEQTRTMFRLGLGVEGMDVVEAADGEDALELAARERPDVVVLGAMSQPGHATAVLRALKSHALTGAIPVVMVTPADRRGDRIEYWIAGASAQIARPFSLDELSRTVRRLGAMTPADLAAHRHDLLGRLRELA